MRELLLLAALGLVALFGWIVSEPIGAILRLRRIPTRPIAALPDGGLAKASGRAGGTLLHSPIGAAPCVLWDFEVQELQRRHWVTIAQQTSSQPVSIEDATGRIWIVPAGATLVLHTDLRADHRLAPRHQAALERLGIPLRGVFGFRRALRIRERRILPDAQIFAYGLAERAGGQLRLCATPALPLVVADRSERALLHTLYWRVAVSLFLALAGLGMVAWVLAGR